MMKIYNFVGMIVLMFIFMLSACEAKSDPVSDYAYKSLRQAILSSINNKMAAETKGLKELTGYDGDGLILLLGEIADDDAQYILLSLLDVYLGSSSGEALTYVITKQGEKIATKLRMTKEKKVGIIFGSELNSIKEKFNYLRFMNIADRNRKIDRILDLIGRGIIVKYDL